MSEILKQSGFEVTIATISGEVLKRSYITLTPDFKLDEVNIDDYIGFILPFMEVDQVSSEAVTLKRLQLKVNPSQLKMAQF